MSDHHDSRGALQPTPGPESVPPSPAARAQHAPSRKRRRESLGQPAKRQKLSTQEPGRPAAVREPQVKTEAVAEVIVLSSDDEDGAENAAAPHKAQRKAKARAVEIIEPLSGDESDASENLAARRQRNEREQEYSQTPSRPGHKTTKRSLSSSPQKPSGY